MFSTSPGPEHRPKPEQSRDARRPAGEWPAVGGGPGGGRQNASADPDCRRLQGGGQETDPGRGESVVDWGKYEPAIRRWEHLTGREAPPPTEPGMNGRPRLSPVFVEWMMGLPPGWVTEFGFTRKDAFRLLGNGVVPQQAALAINGLFYELSA